MVFRLPNMTCKHGFISVKQFHINDSGNFKHCSDPAFQVTSLNTLQQPPGNAGPVRHFLGGEFALLACGADQFAQKTDCRAVVT